MDNNITLKHQELFIGHKQNKAKHALKNMSSDITGTNFPLSIYWAHNTKEDEK